MTEVDLRLLRDIRPIMFLLNFKFLTKNYILDIIMIKLLDGFNFLSKVCISYMFFFFNSRNAARVNADESLYL